MGLLNEQIQGLDYGRSELANYRPKQEPVGVGIGIQAKGTAVQEGNRLLAAAQQQITLETSRARESLRKEVAQIAVSAASAT